MAELETIAGRKFEKGLGPGRPRPREFNLGSRRQDSVSKPREGWSTERVYACSADVTLEQYIHQIGEIAQRSAQTQTELWEWLANLYEAGDPAVCQAIQWREAQLTAPDIERAQGYLPIGFLNFVGQQTRLAFFTVSFEVAKELREINRVSACEGYRREHPIFSQIPDLWQELRTTAAGSCDYELLSLKRFKQYLDTELLELNGWYFALSSHLSPSIVSWTGQKFPQAAIYARLNPYVCKRDRIITLNCETIVPPNPNWWATAKLHRGEVDGGSFCLQECPLTRENFTRHWEYQMKGLRKLEVHAVRRNSGNLSMMIEELEVQHDGCLLGRMIHLDSDCPVGTPAVNCVLNHLDLAVNYYPGSASQVRLGQDLSSGGKVVDATHRIHIFRVEGVPLATLFDYAERFFESKILKAEWRASQTGASP